MRYSISQLATMAGISARTLRHYDAIGLLAPAEIGANGYRWYGREQLLRLQRILLLREVGVPLGQIGQVIDGQVNEITALRAQREQILAEQHRLGTVIETSRPRSPTSPAPTPWNLRTSSAASTTTALG